MVANVGSASEEKSIYASERDTEANRQRRAEYLARIETIEPKRLIFLDESGVSTQMTRRCGRAAGGARLREAVGWRLEDADHTRSDERTRLLASMTVEPAMDRELFLTYLDEVLCPKLKPGDVVVIRPHISVVSLAGDA